MGKVQQSVAAVGTVEAGKSPVTGRSACRSPTEAAIRTSAALPSSTGTMPLLTQFDRKIGLNDEATTARNPYSKSAQAACSRLDPHPKLAPESRLFAAAKRGSLRMKPGLGSRAPTGSSSQPANSPSGSDGTSGGQGQGGSVRDGVGGRGTIHT